MARLCSRDTTVGSQETATCQVLHECGGSPSCHRLQKLAQNHRFRSGGASEGLPSVERRSSSGFRPGCAPEGVDVSHSAQLSASPSSHGGVGGGSGGSGDVDCC
eukprot:7308402-Alexandrium_andersonii.AAC.1